MPRHASIRPQGHSGKQYPIGDSDSNYCLRDPGNYTWDLATRALRNVLFRRRRRRCCRRVALVGEASRIENGEKKREREIEKKNKTIESHRNDISRSPAFQIGRIAPDVLLSAFPPLPRYPRANWQSASPELDVAGRRIDVDVGVGVVSRRVASPRNEIRAKFRLKLSRRA